MATTAATIAGPKVGDHAPDFKVRTTDGTTFELSEATKTDNVIVAFFPAAFTSVCTREMCTFTERLNELQSNHAKVIGISGDLHYALKAWAEKNDIRVPLGSDNDHEVVARYGVAYPLYRDFYRGVPKRSVFVVDKRGMVRYRWVSEDAAAEPNYGEVLQVVSELA